MVFNNFKPSVGKPCAAPPQNIAYEEWEAPFVLFTPSLINMEGFWEFIWPPCVDECKAFYYNTVF